ncbi:tyrosine-type recombinase/integrase [Bacteriovoracaceae bacterium]|nr:tyrosine-type recombinase/integrase [Bacteriovoracaceae bacterium]
MNNGVIKKEVQVTSFNQNIHRQFLKTFEDLLVHQNKSPHTIKNYRRDVIKLICWWQAYAPKKPLWKIKSSDIGQFILLLKNGGKIYKKIRVWKISVPLKHETIKYEQSKMSISSQRRIMSSVNSFFEFLYQRERDFPFWKKRFKQSPIVKHLHHIKLKDEDVDHTEIFPAKYWSHLLEQAWKVEDKLMLHLLFYAGLRIAEVSKLKKKDFNHETGELNIIRKGGKRHHYYVQKAPTIERLWLAQTLKSPNEFLFPNRYKDSHLSQRAMYQRVKNLIKKAGLRDELAPHSFRKSCATELYSHTKDLLLVRDYLNHSDAKVTQTYIETKDFRSELARI